MLFSKVNLTEEEEAEALATPLLAAAPSEIDEFGAQLLESLNTRNSSSRTRMETTSSTAGSSDNNNNNNYSNSNSNMTSMMMATAGYGYNSPMMRGTIAWCLRIRTLAEATAL